MTTLSLHSHPATPCPAIQSIQVQVEPQTDGSLRLHYRIEHAPDSLLIPAASTPGFADGLWERTCLEAFIAEQGSATYREFNFSPSGQWAAYAFHAYRERDTTYTPGISPGIQTQRSATHLELTADIPVALHPTGKNLQLGLTAVIELTNGGRSYWALAHPGEKPDFHQREAFCAAFNAEKVTVLSK